MIAVIFGLFGLIVGSFLNVVILRFGERSTRRRPAYAQGFGRALQGFGGQVGGRSECPNCWRQLAALDMVPVVSWIFLRGRCRYCKAPISVQYPLVEAATAVFFAAIGASALPPLQMLFALPIAGLLVCIFTYDLRTKFIPDLWAWLFIVLALVNTVFSFEFFVFSLLAGPLAAMPILFLWYLSKPFTGHAGQWMGFGDVKLALGIGWLLGFPLGFVSIFLAFIIGAVVSVCILLPLPYYIRLLQRVGDLAHAARLALFSPVGGDGVNNNVDQRSLPTRVPTSDHANLDAGYTMKSEVPFGPFLVAAGVIVWLMIMYNIEIPLLL